MPDKLYKVSNETIPLIERPMSMQSVVDSINSPDITYAKVQRAVKQGCIPSYTLQNNRPLIRICDVFESMGIYVEGVSDGY